jgi:hypothetical protein
MKFIFTIIFAFCFSLNSFSQSGVNWSTSARIANNSYGNYHPRITLDRKGNPLVIWGTGKIVYFSRWTGTGFTTPVQLNPMAIPIFTDTWAGPDIASHGDTVYVVFKHTPEDTNHIYIVRSFDGGQNFSNPVRIDYIGSLMSRFPAVTTDDIGNPIVAFMKFDATLMKPQYVVVKSKDFGKTFSSEVVASGFSGGNVCSCCPATVISTPSRNVMVYRDDLSNIRDIWTGISNDGGNTYTSGFDADQSKWNINSCPASGPDAFISGTKLFSTYMSQASGTALVYVSKADLYSGTANAGTPVTGKFTGLNSQNYPRIATDGTAGAIVWRQNTTTAGQIAMSFTNDISKGFPSAYEVLSTGTLINADVAMSNGRIFVVWENDATGSVVFQQGTFHTTGVSPEPQIKEIQVYPNPAKDFINISLDGTRNIEKIMLINSLGQQITFDARISTDHITIPLTHVIPGFYNVMITEKGGTVYRSKLVVQ